MFIYCHRNETLTGRITQKTDHHQTCVYFSIRRERDTSAKYINWYILSVMFMEDKLNMDYSIIITKNKTNRLNEINLDNFTAQIHTLLVISRITNYFIFEGTIFDRCNLFFLLQDCHWWNEYTPLWVLWTDVKEQFQDY